MSKKPTTVGFRDVHVDGIGQICGKAIDQQGRVDRFLWLDGDVTLESQMDAVTSKKTELGSEFAGLGASLKRGFLKQYEDCVAAGS